MSDYDEAVTRAAKMYGMAVTVVGLAAAFLTMLLRYPYECPLEPMTSGDPFRCGSFFNGEFDFNCALRAPLPDPCTNIFGGAVGASWIGEVAGVTTVVAVLAAVAAGLHYLFIGQHKGT